MWWHFNGTTTTTTFTVFKWWLSIQISGIIFKHTYICYDVTSSNHFLLCTYLFFSHSNTFDFSQPSSVLIHSSPDERQSLLMKGITIFTFHTRSQIDNLFQCFFFSHFSVLGWIIFCFFRLSFVQLLSMSGISFIFNMLETHSKGN